MKSAHVILEYYFSKRDFTDSKMDAYVQHLITFHVHAQNNDEEEAFLNLLEQAFNQGKYIIHVSPHAEYVLYDGYSVANLVLADEPE